MPGENTDGSTIADTSTETTTDADASNDTAAPADDLDQNGESTGGDEGAHEANDNEAGGEEGGDGKADTTSDDDIRAILRGTDNKTDAGTDKKPLQGKAEPGKEAAKPAAGTKDGKPAAGDKPAGETAPTYDDRIAAFDKALSEGYEEKDAAVFKPVVELFKDMAKELAELRESTKEYGQETQARYAMAFHGECDRLAESEGFKELLGSTKDGTANVALRAEVWADAKAAMERCAAKGRPITEARALRFAVGLAADEAKASGKGGTSNADKQKAAQARQARLSIPPKAAGGAGVKAPSKNDDPDAAAHGEVAASLRRLGIKK